MTQTMENAVINDAINQRNEKTHARVRQLTCLLKRAQADGQEGMVLYYQVMIDGYVSVL